MASSAVVLTRPLPPRIALMALALVALLAGVGCETSCGDSDQRAISYADGQVTSYGERGVYQTSPLDGTWLHFPSQRRFVLEHGLGTTDVAVAASLAFNEHPFDRGTGFSAAAGDEVVVEEIGEDSIQVRNDTCAEFFLHVRVEALSPLGGGSGMPGLTN